jgi:hypothetical protein
MGECCSKGAEAAAAADILGDTQRDRSPVKLGAPKPTTASGSASVVTEEPLEVALVEVMSDYW